MSTHAIGRETGSRRVLSDPGCNFLSNFYQEIFEMTNAKHVMTLFVRRRKALQIERDSKYPQMWRVRLPDGTLTDMVNLTRAKDAALDIAEGIETRKTPHKSPLKSLGNFSWSWSPVASNEDSGARAAA
jgi:hypothetical protein